MGYFGIPFRNGVPIGLGSIVGFGAPQEFSPSELFLGGTAGAWYDPSDLTTLFTTSAGTTQCAMPGQGSAVSVGAMLDKRATGYSLFFDGTGDNLETPNSAAFQFGTGDFTVEGWIYVTGALSGYRIIAQCAGNSSWGTGWTLTTRDDKLSLWFNASEVASSAVGAIVANTWVHVAATRSGTNVRLWINGGSAATATSSADLQPTRAVSIGAETSPFSFPFQGYISNVRVVKGTAVYTSAFTPPTASLSPITGTSLLTCGVTWSGNPTITKNGDVRIDGLNPFTTSPVGNHAIAFNDTTARPELRARVNLLTYSEEFDNGAWTKQASSVTANAAIAPNGTNTADLYIPNTTNTAFHSLFVSNTYVATPYTYSVSAKPGGYQYLILVIYDGAAAYKTCVFDVLAGTVTQTAAGATTSISAEGNGWYRCSVTLTAVAGSGFAYVGAVNASTWLFGATSFAGDGTSGIYIWGADLRPANIGANVPAYQRIADANTYDTSGFPLYLRFDGIDDSMYTPANLNLSGTDKVAVFAGVRKNADVSIIAEFSANAGANNGAFLLATGGWGAENGTYVRQSRGTATSFAQPATNSYPSPQTNVLTGTSDIAGDSVVLRINGAQVATSATDQGSGNYGAYPLYIGARNNSSLWFNGHLHSLIIAGSAVSAGNISATEQWVAQKTGLVIP